MGEERNWFDKLALGLENHRRGVQYGAYSMAIVGLAVALRSVRPFQKFASPKDIPASFIGRRMRLSGRVLRVEPSSASIPTTLVVDHFPVIGVPFRRTSNTGLPVQIASVDVSSNGISWLQHVVVGKDINFTLLTSSPHSVSCIVDHQKRNVGVDLVSLGFGSVSPIEFALEKEPSYLSYYKSLISAENKAERKGLGIWHGEVNRYQIVDKILSRMNKPIKALYERAKNQIKSKKISLV